MVDITLEQILIIEPKETLTVMNYEVGEEEMFLALFFFSFPDSSLVWISRILGWFRLLFGPGESRGAEAAAAGI